MFPGEGRGGSGRGRRAAYTSIEENILLAAMQDGAAQPARARQPKTDIPPGSLPCGKIGNVSLSRLFIGGNLIGGWAHSRDLMYASKLFTSYNTEAKIFETLELAQACGINTIQLDPSLLGRGDEVQPDAHHEDPDHGLHPADRGQGQDERRDQAPGGPGRHADLFARRRRPTSS